jgi:hypothetical protein
VSRSAHAGGAIVCHLQSAEVPGVVNFSSGRAAHSIAGILSALKAKNFFIGVLRCFPMHASY